MNPELDLVCKLSLILFTNDNMPDKNSAETTKKLKKLEDIVPKPVPCKSAHLYVLGTGKDRKVGALEMCSSCHHFAKPMFLVNVCLKP